MRKGLKGGQGEEELLETLGEGRRFGGGRSRERVVRVSTRPSWVASGVARRRKESERSEPGRDERNLLGRGGLAAIETDGATADSAEDQQTPRKPKEPKDGAPSMDDEREGEEECWNPSHRVLTFASCADTDEDLPPPLMSGVRAQTSSNERVASLYRASGDLARRRRGGRHAEASIVALALRQSSLPLLVDTPHPTQSLPYVGRLQKGTSPVGARALPSVDELSSSVIVRLRLPSPRDTEDGLRCPSSPAAQKGASQLAQGWTSMRTI